MKLEELQGQKRKFEVLEKVFEIAGATETLARQWLDDRLKSGQVAVTRAGDENREPATPATDERRVQYMTHDDRIQSGVVLRALRNLEGQECLDACEALAAACELARGEACEPFLGVAASHCSRALAFASLHGLLEQALATCDGTPPHERHTVPRIRRLLEGAAARPPITPTSAVLTKGTP
ncbi:MAG TPA: hypothetical protein VGG39_08870 [Polyangiaceae bacterium]|jgi:hypothetical protein